MYDDYASKLNNIGQEIGTSGSASFFIFGDNFSAENITFENSAGEVGQAVAVRVDADKIKFTNCRFLGNQDTLYLVKSGSRQYFNELLHRRYSRLHFRSRYRLILKTVS